MVSPGLFTVGFSNGRSSVVGIENLSSRGVVHLCDWVGVGRVGVDVLMLYVFPSLV